MNYRQLTFTCIMTTIVAICQAEEPKDTVKVIENAQNIIITRQNGKTILDADFPSASDDKSEMMMHFRYELNVQDKDSIDIEDEFPDNWGLDYPFANLGSPKVNVSSNGKYKITKSVNFFRHLYFGWRFNYGDKYQIKNCFEAGIGDVVGVSWSYRGAEFEFGLGFGAQRMLAKEGFCYSKAGDNVVITPLEEGHKIDHSWLDVFRIEVPVLYNQSISKYAKFSIGGIINFNTYAEISTSTKMGNNKYSTKYKGLQQNLLTVDAKASVNFYGVGIYARWSPMRLFNHPYGPEVKSYSLGFELNF